MRPSFATRRRASAREAILGAAESLVSEQGAVHLTLEAVAERAGVSKGGLLYHYPSKTSLLRGMIDRLLRRFESDQAAVRSRLKPSASAGLEACVRAGFRAASTPERVSAALLAAGANDPGLLSPVRRTHQRRFRDLTRGTRHPGRVRLLLLALDGLWVNELLRTSPLSTRQRRALERECVALAREIC